MFANDPGAVVADIIISGIDAAALTVLVFTRRSFGERFFTPAKYVLGLIILSFVVGMRDLAHDLAMGLAGLPFFIPVPRMQIVQPGLIDAARLFRLAYMLAGAIHLALGWLRSWRGTVPVYSKSTGEPLLTFNGRIGYWLTTTLLEPIAILIGGSALTTLDPSLSMTYFVVLAIFLAISAQHQRRLARDEMLDQQDARILAGFYAAQAKNVANGGRPTPKLGGVFLPLVLPSTPGAQVNMLRQWASRYRDEAAESAPANTAGTQPAA
jgi:hypothetical protein